MVVQELKGGLLTPQEMPHVRLAKKNPKDASQKDCCSYCRIHRQSKGCVFECGCAYNLFRVREEPDRGLAIYLPEELRSQLADIGPR